MKRYISYIACLALSIIAIGCVKSDIGSDIEQGGELTLQLSNGALTTRATRANDSSNNEDLLNSVQLFFYPKGSESSNAVYTYTVANFPTTDANGKASTAGTANKSTTVKIKISAGDLDKMFPNNATECSVYAIANGPTPATNAATDVASLKAMSIEADFTTATQASFVMDSDICTIEKKDGKNLSGTVELTRAAAKIELAVNASNIVIDGKTYMPQIANMKVALLSGVKKGLVDDGSDETPVDHNVAADYFNIDIDPGRGFTNGVQTTPFYSYSSMWKAGDDDEATLKLMIPWGVSADGTTAPSTYLNYIYEVPVNDLGKSIVRNKYYKITLNVGVLGSLDEKPVTLNPSYVVLDWGTGEVDVELSRPKYLVVDENSVVMNNINSYSVGYQSSDAISVAITKIEYPNLMTGDTTTAYNNTTGTTSTNGFTVSKNDNVVTLNHVLDNDRTDGVYDYFPYTVTVVVKNTVSGFSETIVFKQYPAIYVEADKNTDYDDGSSWQNDKNDNKGYTSVNNGSTSYGNNDGLTGTNKNWSMYTITVSALDSDEFIIGDPRSTSIINPTGSTTAPALYDGARNRQLKYYYPTEPASDKIIAPKFRIASSYGVTSAISYDNAQKRCAFYQEDGYPAGRWRMPTPAEIKYMIQFANEGKITVLLSADTYYWSGYNKTAYRYNEGSETITGSTNPNEGYNGRAYVRCVYDEWYWGSEKACDIETFTWGDALRPN
ncbi:MAG: hypothetical protein IJ378_06425 [Alistipes sp.]|nr:hypothetical protein [Alistipes sp.]